MELSKEQEEAVNFIDGQAVLISIPGSGKTTVIVKRAVHMVEAGIDPYSMLTITFTKAAADEMQRRFKKYSNANVQFSTIHAFCYRLLCSRYGYTQDSILKQSEQWMFIAERLRNAGTAPNEIEEATKEVMNGIGFVLNREMKPNMFIPEKIDKGLFNEIYRQYEEYKLRIGKIDFDDMVILFRDKLKTDNDFLLYLKNRYKYITIDEFQDTNKIQAEIFYMIAGDDGNIFIVGDDDQSIYGFRAAQSQIMLDFPKKYPNCRQIYNSTNYRSGKDIIKYSSNLIKYNKNRFLKEFHVNRSDDGEVKLTKYDNGAAENKDLIKTIMADHDKGASYDDMAVLFRTNSQAVPITTLLVKKDIPFYMTEHISGIHESPIFGDIKAYYRLANKKEKEGDVQRILNKPSRYLKSELFKDCRFDKKEMLYAARSLKPFAREKIIDMFWDIEHLKGKNPTDFMRALSMGIGYRSWLKDRAAYFGKDVNEYYQIFDALKEEADMFSTMEEWIEYAVSYEKKLREASKAANRKGICLSTFHGSKGLEWKNVYILDANDGFCPYKKAETSEELEEERRMFYVAMTRAKDKLHIMYVNSKLDPSPYLYEAKLLKK